MEKKTIGTFLAALRKANGLTQKQLADKLNVSDKAVSRWERDECAPDLSLIPVLAEIYGVTSDEILRGQRANPDSPVNDSNPAKTEKQLNHLLASTQTKFRIRSMIAAAIAFVGLIAACICNFELGEANIGFMLGTIFYVVAIICEISFAILGSTAVSDEEFRSAATANYKNSMLLLTEAIVSVTILLFAATLPMAGASHAAVDAIDCLYDSTKYILIAAILCSLCCLILNIALKQHKISIRSNLRLRCSGILSIVLIILLLIHTGLNHYLISNRHSYAPCEEHSTLNDFKKYIKTPLDPDGYFVDIDKTPISDSETVYKFTNHLNDQEYIRSSNEVVKCLIEVDTPVEYRPNANLIPKPDYFTAEYGYYFEHLNLYVAHYEVSNIDDLVPIYTFTADQFAEANSIAINLSLSYTLLYAIAIAVTIVIYCVKQKKLP